MRKQDYFDFVSKSAEIGKETYEEGIKNWKESFNVDFMFGYTSAGIVSKQIHLESLLYRETKTFEKAEATRKYLLQPMILSQIFPEEVRRERIEYKLGVPPVEPLFQLHSYLSGYEEIIGAGILSKEEDDIIRETIIRSITTIFYCPEWGAHNRSMLRASALVQAYQVIGEGEETKDWLKLADYLAEESIGRWTIEDASLYNAIWLFACIMYARYRGIESTYYSHPQTKYYFDYFTHFICPNGRIPGFGDSFFHSNWHIWAACLEMGATKYRCGRMKKAADLIVEFGMKTRPNVLSSDVSNYLAYACKWADDSIIPESLDFTSEEVLDEVIGKKIVFRDKGIYFLYNYCDEGNSGYLSRRYLRTSIPVKAEKMHHGHSDEGSIVTLEKDGNILLHESGYRDRLPNGKYRSDVYHTRLSFRKGLLTDKNTTYDKLHDDGYYKQSKTQKIHFQRFPETDYLRTRNIYDSFHLVWDRAITYLKEEEAFILLDYVTYLQQGEMTTVNNIHTQHAMKIREGVYDTYIDTINRGMNDDYPFVNSKEYSLLVEFISNPENCTKENIRRNYGEASMLSEVVSKSYDAGDKEVLITLLTVKKRTDAAEKMAGKLEVKTVKDNNEALSLIYHGKEKIQLTYKLNLEFGVHECKEDRAPAYDWESGKIDYGVLTTDADFSYLMDKEKIKYGIINGCRLYYNDKDIFKAPRYTSRDFLLEFFKEIDHKWRAWNGELTK